MIKNKKDYKYYLSQDIKRLFNGPPSIIERIKNPIYKYQKTLRYCEYLLNTTHLKTPYLNPIYLLEKMRLRRLGIRMGFSISENCFEEGLSIAHYGSIIVNPNAKIGKNCRIHSGVNIGVGARGEGTPIIGDDCYIGPGAKIFGNIVIGDHVFIGANAVVNKSFVDGNCSIGGGTSAYFGQYKTIFFR